MKPDSYSSDEMSEFNEAFFQIQRISQCFEKCNQYHRRGLFGKWKTELDIIWDEMMADCHQLLTDKDYEILVTNGVIMCHSKIIEANKENNREKLYYWLRRKHRIMRLILNKTGKGTKIIKMEDEGMT